MNKARITANLIRQLLFNYINYNFIIIFAIPRVFTIYIP